MADDINEARMQRLSPQTRELAEEIDSRVANAPADRSPEELLGDLVPRMAALTKREREGLGTVVAAQIAEHQRRIDANVRERDEALRLGDLIERAERLSGRDFTTVAEAVDWLRDNGHLTAEEESFVESVMDRTVEVKPEER